MSRDQGKSEFPTPSTRGVFLPHLEKARVRYGRHVCLRRNEILLLGCLVSTFHFSLSLIIVYCWKAGLISSPIPPWTGTRSEVNSRANRYHCDLEFRLLGRQQHAGLSVITNQAAATVTMQQRLNTVGDGYPIYITSSTISQLAVSVSGFRFYLPADGFLNRKIVMRIKQKQVETPTGTAGARRLPEVPFLPLSGTGLRTSLLIRHLV